MAFAFSFRPYRHRFIRPLLTAHGTWSFREGIILELKDSCDRVGIGEIAPLPWFGSESLEQALGFCDGLGLFVTEEAIAQIPDHLPACQFALGCALENLQGLSVKNRNQNPEFSYLLPNRADALGFLTQAPAIAPTYKWKIGIDPIAMEIDIFKQILSLLPEKAVLRLDANGGLSLTEARRWLTLADECDRVEFIEQPLEPKFKPELLALSQDYATPIALDEAIANFAQIQSWYDLGWRGIYVIKAAIMGYPWRLREFCRNKSLDLVFSSVFETRIGRQAVLNLAAELGNSKRALGFGVGHWLEEYSEFK